MLLGFRELRDAAHYHDDPLVQRVLGLNGLLKKGADTLERSESVSPLFQHAVKHLSGVAMISRMLKEADQRSVDKLRQLLTDMVSERIGSLSLRRVTLDFDGSGAIDRTPRRRSSGWLQ